MVELGHTTKGEFKELPEKINTTPTEYVEGTMNGNGAVRLQIRKKACCYKLFMNNFASTPWVKETVVCAMALEKALETNLLVTPLGTIVFKGIKPLGAIRRILAA